MGVFTKFIFLSVTVLILSSVFLDKHEETEGELTHLPYELTGNLKSSVVIVFLHGWPNTFRLWDKTIAEIKKEFLCLNISYPNFSSEVHKKWGIDLIDTAHLIKKTVDLVETEQHRKLKNYLSPMIGEPFLLTSPIQNIPAI
jgi:hypothetical protein